MAPKKAKLEEMNSLLAAANATLAIKQVRFVSGPLYKACLSLSTRFSWCTHAHPYRGL